MKKIALLIVVVLFLLMAVDVAEASTLGNRTLYFGKRGGDVRQLQSKLSNVGYHVGSADGIYGKLTENAVINFQKDMRIKIDGIAGWKTIKELVDNSLVDYIVSPGDTLIRIARDFGITVNNLKAKNGLYNTMIYAGQNLKVPQSEVKTASINNNDFLMNITPKEFELLKRAVYSEGRGEPYKGQVAIAAVIMNRIRDPRFPNTISEVIFEPWAFTAVHDGQFWLEPDPSIARPIEDALKGWDPSGGALFYYNPAKVTSYWIYSRTVIDRIGRHFFAI